MDPDVALENMRKAVISLQDELLHRHGGDVDARVEQVTSAWEALDGWMSKGGFRPKDWEP